MLSATRQPGGGGINYQNRHFPPLFWKAIHMLLVFALLLDCFYPPAGRKFFMFMMFFFPRPKGGILGGFFKNVRFFEKFLKNTEMKTASDFSFRVAK